MAGPQGAEDGSAGGSGVANGEPSSVGGTSNNGTSRHRHSFSRVVPEQGKKRVNYAKGDARRIMEEAVSLCEAMTLDYEVVFHGRRRSSGQKSASSNNEEIRLTRYRR